MGRHSAKPSPLPSVNRGKEWRRPTAVTWCWLSAKGRFAECQALPSAWRSAKSRYAESFSLPRAALGKRRLCRVPDIWHSAKRPALGNFALCGSVWPRIALLFLVVAVLCRVIWNWLSRLQEISTSFFDHYIGIEHVCLLCLFTWSDCFSSVL
jgi:hypothetical protein